MKTKQRLFVILLLAIVIYILSFLVQHSYLATKISLILSTLVLIYTLMVYSIKTKVKLFDDHLGLDIERKPFFGRSFYILLVSLLILMILFQWVSNLSLWIEVNGFYSMEFISFGVCAFLFAVFLIVEMRRKDTLKYWRQIPYSKRIGIDMLILSMTIFAIMYDSVSFISSIIKSGIIFIVVLIILAFKRSNSLFKNKDQKEITHYYDQFAKPHRSR